MITTINDELLRSLAPTRGTGAHKWGVGGVLIVAGSPQYPGAAWLASRSSGRSGAGIVTLATPRSVVAIMASAMPEVAFVPLPDSDAPGSAYRAVERMQAALSKSAAVVIGPGLGDDDSTSFLLNAWLGIDAGSHRGHTGFGFGAAESTVESGSSIFESFDGQIVIDADGPNWLAKQHEWWTHVPPHRVVLTPHPGEAHRLSGIDVDRIVADPAGIALELATKWQQTVVIKSGFSAASNGDATVVADTAPTSLATAGSGDCFAGAIGAYLAQGCPPLDAAALAIGIGSRAALLLENTFGFAGVLASDLPDSMARAMQNLYLTDNEPGGRE